MKPSDSQCRNLDRLPDASCHANSKSLAFRKQARTLRRSVVISHVKLGRLQLPLLDCDDIAPLTPESSYPPAPIKLIGQRPRRKGQSAAACDLSRAFADMLARDKRLNLTGVTGSVSNSKL